MQRQIWVRAPYVTLYKLTLAEVRSDFGIDTFVWLARDLHGKSETKLTLRSPVRIFPGLGAPSRLIREWRLGSSVKVCQVRGERLG
jgi:hypothetical protein